MSTDYRAFMDEMRLKHTEMETALGEPAEDRVKRGAKLLDATKPRWREVLSEQVRLGRFGMRDGCYCIMGLLYGGFFEGVVKIWTEEEGRVTKSIRHGFFSRGRDCSADYDRLERLWTEEILRGSP